MTVTSGLMTLWPPAGMRHEPVGILKELGPPSAPVSCHFLQGLRGRPASDPVSVRRVSLLTAQLIDSRGVEARGTAREQDVDVRALARGRLET